MRGVWARGGSAEDALVVRIRRVEERVVLPSWGSREDCWVLEIRETCRGGSPRKESRGW